MPERRVKVARERKYMIEAPVPVATLAKKAGLDH